MTLGDILKQYRDENKISMDEFSRRSSLSKGYISMLENNINPRNNKPIAPTLPTIQKIAIGMNIDVDTLLKSIDQDQQVSLVGESVETVIQESFKNSKEKELIDVICNNLVQLNESGLNQIISYTNDLLKISDYCRVALNEAEIISFKNTISTRSSQKRKKHLYTYMHKIACAGTGFYFDDIPTDLIEAPYMEGADYIIGVNGDSMEPTFYDGDMVYVEKRQIIDTGDIGIFVINNECFIKEAGEYGLISHNPNYDTISGNESIQCIGKVLGKVNAETPAVTRELSPEDERARNIGRILSSQKDSKQNRNKNGN